MLLSPRHLEQILCAMGATSNDLPTRFARVPKIMLYLLLYVAWGPELLKKVW
jgi:hypothetical protein